MNHVFVVDTQHRPMSRCHPAKALLRQAAKHTPITVMETSDSNESMLAAGHLHSSPTQKKAFPGEI